MRKGIAALIVLIVLLLLAGIAILGSYNGLIGLRENVTESMSEIDNQLQRRMDLIPNLVESVKGYMKFEEKVIKDISDARARMAGAKDMKEKIAADEELTGALGRLLVVVENYPDLKANQSFLSLMDELAGTENRISVARMRYNESLKNFNVASKKFPGVLVANLFKIKVKEEYFQATKNAKEEVPKVEFD